MWTVTLSDPLEITYGKKVVCGANGIQFSDKISKSINWISVNGSYKLICLLEILLVFSEKKETLK